MAEKLPFEWSEEIEQKIVELHSEGEALLDILAKRNMPTRAELNKHERQHAAFHKQMQIAREQFQQFIFEECLQIADDSDGDYRRRVGRNGEPKEPELDLGSIQRSKVRIDTRLKLLRTIDPVKYGGKAATGKGAEVPRAAEPGKQLSDIELGRRTAFVLEKARRAAVASQPVKVAGVTMPPPKVNGSAVVEDLL